MMRVALLLPALVSGALRSTPRAKAVQAKEHVASKPPVDPAVAQKFQELDTQRMNANWHKSYREIPPHIQKMYPAPVPHKKLGLCHQHIPVSTLGLNLSS